jgi:putative phage-type endonuclease
MADKAFAARVRALQDAILTAIPDPLPVPYYAQGGVPHPKVVAILALPQPEQRTEPWYNMRKTMLTASDLASSLHLNPYDSQNQLLQKKCGLGPVFQGNAATRHGAALEEEVVAKFCAKFGWDHYEGGLLKHPTIDFLGGSPDGLLSRPDGSDCALLEVSLCAPHFAVPWVPCINWAKLTTVPNATL